MGVQGLTSLLHSRAERAPIVDLVARAKSQMKRSSHSRPTKAQGNPSTAASSAAAGCAQTHTSLLLECFARHPNSLFVLVDGLGVFHELTHIDTIAARALPAYDVLHARVTAIVQSLRSVGIELIVYFDTSSTETTKREEILRRAEDRVSHPASHSVAASSIACLLAVAKLTCASEMY